MLHHDEENRAPHEKVLVDAVRDVVSELLLLDLTHLICCVGTQRMKPVQALIDSAIELYFNPGCLQFSNSGHALLCWTGGIKLSLDFEFAGDDIRIYFTVVLQPRMATIQINYLWLGEDAVELSASQRVERTAVALANARRRPVMDRLAWWRESTRPVRFESLGSGEA